MRKNRIRLTESQLNKVIRESVKNALNESTNTYTRMQRNIAYDQNAYGQWTPAQNELLGALHKFVNLSRRYKSLIPRFVENFSDNNRLVEGLLICIEDAIEDVKYEGDPKSSHTGIPNMKYDELYHRALEPDKFDKYYHYQGKIK